MVSRFGGIEATAPKKCVDDCAYHIRNVRRSATQQSLHACCHAACLSWLLEIATVYCITILLNNFEYIYTMIDVYRCQLFEVRRGWYIPACSSVRWQFEHNFDSYMMDDLDSLICKLPLLGNNNVFNETGLSHYLIVIDSFISAWQTCVPWSKHGI